MPFFRGSLKTWGDGSLGSLGKRPAAEAGKPEFSYLAPTCKAGASSMFVILGLGVETGGSLGSWRYSKLQVY